MKDTRVVLDNVRAKVPSGAQMLVAYIDMGGVLHLTQANCDQTDITKICNTVLVSIMRENPNIT